MKSLILTALLALTAANAHASTLVCNTNVNNDPHRGNTSVAITNDGTSTDKVDVSIVIDGGMAQFVTAPVKFVADVSRMGPEVVIYTNAEKQFKLIVGFQPINGEITGTLSYYGFATREEESVVCESH